jgi:hypothetical protein
VAAPVAPRTAAAFLRSAIPGAPPQVKQIRQVQTENGNEFSLAFKLTVEEAGIQHRYIRPRYCGAVGAAGSR